MIFPIRGLYTIADNTFSPQYTPVELARRYLDGGARVIQLRVKSQIPNGSTISPSRAKPRDKSQIQKWAQEMSAMKKKFSFTLIVNDHVDVALEVGADGVHVGTDDEPVAEVRKRVGEKMLIGYSSHSLKEALAAEKAGADYVAFGAIFPSKTKGPGHPVQGLEKLRAVVKAVKIPVVAIGGIDRKNFESVRETSVSAIAMITALTKGEDVASETRSYCCRF